MWTPKRVLILFGGFCLFAVLFVVYSFALGFVDGLPVLPEKYLPGPVLGDHAVGAPSTDEKIVQAFGPDCEELRRELKLFLRSKNLLVSTVHFDIEDGRVKLHPFSAAMFQKSEGSRKFPDINTVKCDIAYLTLDQPIKTMSELAQRKIISIELRAAKISDEKEERGITIANNRGTPSDTDDIKVFVTNAPLFYDDIRGKIWTDGFVRITDFQTQPETTITAQGMELHLTRDGSATTPSAGKNASTAGKGKGDSSHGVELIMLHSHVEMHLQMDSSSGFLGASHDAQKKPADNAAKEKSPVTITTKGLFAYDLKQERAHFQSPKEGQGRYDNERVVVTRGHGIPGKNDQLKCDDLYLQFRQKPPAAAPAMGAPRAQSGTDNRGGDKEIESALATPWPSRLVVLDMSDTEHLYAQGSEMSYLAETATTGPQTTLKGQPLNAVREGHQIEALELLLVGNDKKGVGQRAHAKGAGKIDMFDPKTTRYTQHAFWNESFTFVKVPEKDGKLYDLITLVGNAKFLDDDHKQELRGQRIQVWLEPSGKSAEADKSKSTEAPPPAPTPATASTSQLKPHRLEAWEKVSALGPEVVIKWTNHLVIHFKDAKDKLPEKLPENSAAKPAPADLKGGDPKGGNSPAAPKAAEAPKKEEKKQRPFELEANEVVVYVQRYGPLNQLQELVTEGNVHVIQAGETPKDKGVDITGEMLNLLHYLKGDILYVFGDARRPGRLQMGEIVLVGPKVTINQKDNVAEVEGVGSMRLPGNGTLDGKPAKAGSVLTIYWNKDMVFNGKYADFHGGVIAHQDNGKLKCENMQVTLDREVSFKEGQKDKQSAKVEKILCDLRVYAEDEVKDENGKLIGLSSGSFTQLNVDNLTGVTLGYGSGWESRFGKDSNDPAAPGQAPAPTKKNAKQINKYTMVKFQSRMMSVAKEKTRTTIFYDDVDVFHQPSETPRPTINTKIVPKDGFQLHCHRLKVYTRPVAGKSSNYMEADKQVNFRTDSFFGNADIVKFDEADDIVIFESLPGNIVTITKFNGQSSDQGERIQGKKILYNRKTAAFTIEGASVIQGP